MSTKHYVMDPGPKWHIDTKFDSVFTWDYDDRREKLVKLYEKGKDKQGQGDCAESAGRGQAETTQW